MSQPIIRAEARWLAIPRKSRNRFKEKPVDIRVLRDLAQGFQPQRDGNDCYPTCIKNILDEYYDRMLIPPNPRRIPLKEIRKACGLKGTVFPTSLGLDLIKDAINPDVSPAHAKAMYQDGARSGWRALQSVVTNDEASFPIVTVSPRYFVDEAAPYRTRAQPQHFHHGLIVLKADEDVLLYDPLAKQAAAKDPDRYLVRLQRTKFLNFWSESPYYEEMLWFEPKDGDLFAF